MLDSPPFEIGPEPLAGDGAVAMILNLNAREISEMGV